MSAVLHVEGRDIGFLDWPEGAGRDCGLLWLNAGSIRMAGPFRLHVEASRALAADGWPSARIDLPGVGDHLASAQRAPEAVASSVLDALEQRTGCGRWVVGGICSAADFAWRWAGQEPRIAGLVLFDPLARRAAPGFRWGQLQLLLARGPAGIAEALAKRLRPASATAFGNEQLRDWPAPGEEAGQLAALVARGTEVFALYTGGAASYFTHPRQFHAGYGPASRHAAVRFRHWRDCDHLFMPPAQRERLIGELRDWLRDRLTPSA